MNKRLFLSTAVGVVLTTAAFAQSNSTTTVQPTRPMTTPAPSTTAPSATPAASTSPSSGATVQTQPNTGVTTTPGNPAPAQTQTNSGTPSTPPGQAQTNTSQAGTQANPSVSQTQQTPAVSTNTTATPSAAASPQTSNPNVNVSVNINDQQRTRINQSIARLNVQPLSNVNFSLSVGTAVPRDVRFQPLPTDVVEIVPQYRGYNFFMVRDEIVIVEPSSYQIVAVLPRNGGSASATPVPSAQGQRHVSFSDKDREVIRKHRTTHKEVRGTAVRTQVRVGERLPETVEIESFPDEVYRDAPTLRDYRYIHRENRTYLIEPRERRIIEEID